MIQLDIHTRNKKKFSAIVRVAVIEWTVSRMTLDEAINKNIKMAELQERLLSNADDSLKEIVMKFAAEYRQLAEWLTELKQWRRVYGVCPSYEMCIPECKEGYNAQIAEYKRLLKAAVEDFPDLTDMWRYANEALALIGEDTNVPASADDTNVGHKSGSWISCEDRLPSENTLVLCYARSTTGEGKNYFLGALAHGEFWFLKVNDIGHVSFPVLHWEVTHWQPLPESPKE